MFTDFARVRMMLVTTRNFAQNPAASVPMDRPGITPFRRPRPIM